MYLDGHVTLVSHPIQQDATSCGIYALKFAESILDGSPVAFHNSAESVNSIRMQIAVCLLENTEDLTNLCYFCGLMDGDTNWIGCDVCPRWFHQNCVKMQVKANTGKFVCES
ncbi:hypothetical protein CHARACLAT_015880 [Characodon lateralis]|uniref:PHD-type domain-containing protein n=1 Tax=Characodon lateralis TaxID=208331 RepID=A0ABU7CNI0_9TELE|nr:hypothetical protein [Characodon lateralis]